jgi:hypothetical protein
LRPLRALGHQPIGSTPEQFSERSRAELETWGNMTGAVGIEVN